MRLTIIGLGPGSWGQVTLEAKEALEQATEVYLRTAQHPTVAHMPKHLEIHSFDSMYEEGSSFQAVYEAIVNRIMDLASRPEGAVYCVPGHPLVGEATVISLMERSKAEGMPLRIVSGLSYLEPTLAALGIDALATGLQVVDSFTPRVDPSLPALIGQVYSRAMASDLKLSLLELYPPDHVVTQVSAAGIPELERLRPMPLGSIDHPPEADLGGWDHLSCLYVPPLPLEQNLSTLDGLSAIIARLREPDGCPWDRAQSHSSLRPYLLEEAYEALEALDSGDTYTLAGELGDLLLNILMHVQLASEAGEFTIHDVARGISQKLVRRHPHVFGDLKLTHAEEVVANWESFKEQERGKGQSILEGVSKAMPALAYSREVISRAVSMGLQGEALQGIGDGDEVSALEEALERRSAEEREGFLGDVLFRLVALAQGLEVDAESALRESNSAFYRRFQQVEKLAEAQGAPLSSLSVEKRRELWRQGNG
ncbi:MAG: uncharacterized protein HW403_765 [Dehalococcoidia bacterium]|nr:uncharacterized protein [Dehalococcoidia bacterium]